MAFLLASRRAALPSARRMAASAPRARFASSSSSSSSSSKTRTPLEWYSHMLETKPLATKSVTSFMIVGAGDLMTQVLIEDREDGVDVKRFGIMCFLGGTLVGPWLHVWYNLLFTYVPGATVVPVLQRVALDQLVMAPPFVAIFMSSLLALEGKADQITTVLGAEWKPAVFTNWKMWAPAQMINFGFVPLRFQVLFSNFVALFWNAYLSLASHR